MSKQGGRQASEFKKIGKRDLTVFDDEATQLVMEMMDAGWTGRLSQRGHAIMRAPDGQATHSISRDSLRGRSGRNARAIFERWKLQHAKAQSSVESNIIQMHSTGFEVFDRLVCPDCERVFQTPQGLSAHRKAHNQWQTCPECGMPAKVMGQHYRFNHPGLWDRSKRGSVKVTDVELELPDETPEPLSDDLSPVDESVLEAPVVEPEEPVTDDEAVVEFEEPPVLATILPDPSGLAVPVLTSMEEPIDKRAPVVIRTTPISAMDSLLQVLTELEALREENARLRLWVSNHV